MLGSPPLWISRLMLLLGQGAPAEIIEDAQFPGLRNKIIRPIISVITALTQKCPRAAGWLPPCLYDPILNPHADRIMYANKGDVD